MDRIRITLIQGLCQGPGHPIEFKPLCFMDAPYSVLQKVCGIALNNGPDLCGIALDGPLICRIAPDHTY
jgi:hypothetical protein